MWKIGGSRWWVKLLLVRGKTSLQHHNERDEIHIGISYIKRGEKHRLLPGVYVEIAKGKPREEDITRHQDDYGRA